MIKKVSIILFIIIGVGFCSPVYISAAQSVGVVTDQSAKPKATDQSANLTTTDKTNQGSPIKPPLSNGNGDGTDLKTVFMNILNVVQTILIMLSTMYLIFAGFMFVIAKGDPGKIQKAKDALLWGLIGTALILCAEVLAYGLGDTVKEVFKG